MYSLLPAGQTKEAKAMAHVTNKRIRAFVLALFCVFCSVAHGRERASIGRLAEYIKKKDFLAARVIVSRLKDQLKNPNDRQRIYWILLGHPDIGEDVLAYWQREMDRAEQKIPANARTIASMERYLNWADSAMFAGQSSLAVDGYQKAAAWLKSRREQEQAKVAPSQLVLNGLDQLYPYVLHSLARALYASRRYNDALEVYSWIPTGYSRFHRVLFEKMWSAYYAQRADLALGAISSQHSAYFSDYVDPETYLIQLYLFKRLCRQGEIDKLMNEVKTFKTKIVTGIFTYEDWAKSELFTRRLLRISRQSVTVNDPVVSAGDRRAERDRVRNSLINSFSESRKGLLDNLSLVEAYSTMAVTPGMDMGFKSMRKTENRNELVQNNLEVWPIESKGEEWADEVGNHFYLGEDQCKKAK
jgi:tetratricopeptide (TPR) repeat protein